MTVMAWASVATVLGTQTPHAEIMFGCEPFAYGLRPMATVIHHTQMTEVGIGPYDSGKQTMDLSETRGFWYD